MVLILPTLVLAAVVAASPHGAPHRRHAGVNTPHIELDPETARNGTLVKRGQTFTGARLSMYYPETGNQVACGGFYQNNDFIVALNSGQFESTSGHMCGTPITISYGGKTAQATIVDECPGCPWNGLDCTPGIANFFGFFDDLAWGATWTVGGGDPPPPPPPPPPSSTPPPPPPPPSSTPPPPPPPPPSSTPPPPPPPPPSTSSKVHSTSSSSSSSSVWSASSSSSTTSSSASSSSTPAPSSASTSSIASSSSTSAASSAAPAPTGNIAQLNAAFVNVALLVLAGEAAQ